MEKLLLTFNLEVLVINCAAAGQLPAMLAAKHSSKQQIFLHTVRIPVGLQANRPVDQALGFPVV